MERPRPQAPLLAKVVFALVLVILHLPLLTLFLSAFFEETEAGWVFTLKWFGEVFEDQVLLKAFGNSLIVALTSSTLATALGTMAALALRKGGFLGVRYFRSMVLVAMVLPEIVFALALLSWFYLMGFNLGLHTVIIAHVTFLLAYVTLIVSGRLTSLDSSLEDAGRDLGASEWRILWQIVLPLIRPTIGAAFVISFLLSFDDFLITFFVNGAGQDTLPVILYSSMKIGLTPKLNALATLMFLVSALILFFAFRSSAFRDVLKARENADDIERQSHS